MKPADLYKPYPALYAAVLAYISAAPNSRTEFAAIQSYMHEAEKVIKAQAARITQLEADAAARDNDILTGA